MISSGNMSDRHFWIGRFGSTSLFTGGYVAPEPLDFSGANTSKIVCPLYGISLFLPTIIRTLGYESSTAQLMTVPIYITAAILAVIVAYFSDRVGRRSPFIIVPLLIMVVGFSM